MQSSAWHFPLQILSHGILQKNSALKSIEDFLCRSCLYVWIYVLLKISISFVHSIGHNRPYSYLKAIIRLLYSIMIKWVLKQPIFRSFSVIIWMSLTYNLTGRTFSCLVHIIVVCGRFLGFITYNLIRKSFFCVKTPGIHAGLLI